MLRDGGGHRSVLDRAHELPEAKAHGSLCSTRSPVSW